MTWGVQPRRGDRLQCLECGRWLRAMTWHLVSQHDMTAREYKMAHGLRMMEPLRAADLTDIGREVGRERAQRDSTVADALRAIPAQERRERSRRVRAGALRRAIPLSDATRARRREVAAETNARRAERAHEEAAHAAGWESWEAMIRGTIDQAAAAVGRTVGLSETQILAARRRIIGPDWKREREDWRRRRTL